MTFDLSSLTTSNILKWVIIILITGFITQFGRMFAQYIVRRINERRTRMQQEKPADAPPPAVQTQKEIRPSADADVCSSTESKRIKEQEKQQKKAAKARSKALKKQK